MKRLTSIAAALIMTLIFALTAFAAGEKDVRILFTHDLHSTQLPYEVCENGEHKSVGGWARLSTAIGRNRDANTLLVDGGDFSMGSFFNFIYQSRASELSLLGDMGFDATTFGNHEFDYNDEGIISMLTNARADKLPELLAANIEFAKTAPVDLTAAYNGYGVRPWAAFEKNGVKIGVFGLLGESAQETISHAHDEVFTDRVESAKRCVAEMQAQGVQLIVCLSHSGISGKPEKSEDARLAKAVPEINVIVSAHSHSTVAEPLMVGETIIVCAGAYCRNLGLLDVTVAETGITVKDYRLIAIDSSFEEDKAIAAKIEEYKKNVQDEALTPLGIEFSGVVANSPQDFEPIGDINFTYGEYGVCNLMTDAFLYTAERLGKPSDVAATAAGIVRSSFFKGDITYDEVFNAFSLGMGVDGTIGYPLTRVFLKGREIKALAEVDASITSIMPEAQLYFSGVRYSYSGARMFLNRVYSVEVQNGQGEWEPIEDEKLYSIVCDLYMLQMTSVIKSKSKNLLSVIPRDSDGNPLKDINTAVMLEPSGREVKEWLSLAEYLGSFEPVGGVPTIPLEYYTPRSQKIKLPISLETLIGNMSALTAAIIALFAVVLVCIIALILWFVRANRRRSAKRAADEIITLNAETVDEKALIVNDGDHKTE